jgi:hypothetical protein
MYLRIFNAVYSSRCVIDVNLNYDRNDMISFFSSYCRAVLCLVGCISVTCILSREINILSSGLQLPTFHTDLKDNCRFERISSLDNTLKYFLSRILLL